MTDSSTVNLYFIKTELEYLCAKLICLKINPDHPNLLYYYNERFDGIVDRSDWSLTGYLSYSRKLPFPTRQQRLRECLHRVAADIRSITPEPGKIRIHVNKIPNSTTNYQINFLRRTFRRSRVCVHLIPHGAGDFARGEKDFFRKLKFWLRKFRPADFLFKDISYYVHRGNGHGAEDRIVERVYFLHRAPQFGPPGKAFELPRFNVLSRKPDSPKRVRAALIVGQNLFRKDRLLPEDMKAVTAAVKRFLAKFDLDEIHYSRHPRSQDRMELFDDAYAVLDHRGPVELVLIDTPYDVVVSCYSTVLLNARLILDSDSRVASIGLNRVNIEREESDRLFRAFRDAGIEIIDA